jgi:hypothetical protein
VHPRERRRRVDLGLFVPRLEVPQAAGVLLERLPDPRHVAVAEDAEHPGKERPLDAVALHLLLGEEANQRLRHREPLGR